MDLGGLALTQSACRVCGQQRDVIARCEQCRADLCSSCRDEHASNPLTAGHLLSQRAPSCPAHNMALTCYCEDCACAVCAICPTSMHHRGHHVITLEEGALKLRGKLTERQEDLVARRRALELNIAGCADEGAVTRMRTELAQLDKDVKEFYDQLAKQVQQERAAACQQVARWRVQLKNHEQAAAQVAAQRQQVEQQEAQLAALVRADDVTVVGQGGQLVTRPLPAVAVDTAALISDTRYTMQKHWQLGQKLLTLQDRETMQHAGPPQKKTKTTDGGKQVVSKAAKKSAPGISMTKKPTSVDVANNNVAKQPKSKKPKIAPSAALGTAPDSAGVNTATITQATTVTFTSVKPKSDTAASSSPVQKRPHQKFIIYKGEMEGKVRKDVTDLVYIGDMCYYSDATFSGINNLEQESKKNTRLRARRLAVTVDGMLAFTCDIDGCVKVIDMSSGLPGKEVHRFGRFKNPLGLAQAADGTWAVGDGSEVVIIRDQKESRFKSADPSTPFKEISHLAWMDNHRLMILDCSGVYVYSRAGQQQMIISGPGGATCPKLRGPRGLRATRHGTVLISDAGGVAEVTSQGRWHGWVTDHTKADRPCSAAVSGSGTELAVCSAENNKLHRFIIKAPKQPK